MAGMFLIALIKWYNDFVHPYIHFLCSQLYVTSAHISTRCIRQVIVALWVKSPLLSHVSSQKKLHCLKSSGPNRRYLDDGQSHPVLPQWTQASVWGDWITVTLRFDRLSKPEVMYPSQPTIFSHNFSPSLIYAITMLFRVAGRQLFQLRAPFTCSCRLVAVFSWVSLSNWMETVCIRKRSPSSGCL